MKLLGYVPGFLTFTNSSGVPHQELEEQYGRALKKQREIGRKEAEQDKTVLGPHSGTD